MIQYLKKRFGKYLTLYIKVIAILVALCIGVYVFSSSFDLYKILDDFLASHELISIDEIFFVGVFAWFGLVIFSMRRYRELEKEIENSTIAKRKLEKEITFRIQIEKESKLSEEQYRDLFDQSADAIYLQEGGKYEIVNNKFLELFGITQDQIDSGEFSIFDYTHPNSIPLLKERVQKLHDGVNLPSIYEFTIVTKEKREVELEASISYILKDGKLKTQGVLRDISNRKQTECIQSAIYLIAEAANMTDNLDDLLESIHTILKSIIDAENLFVEFYDDKTGLYTSAYFVDQYDVVDKITMDLKGSLTDYIRRTERASIIDEKLHAELVEAGEAEYIMKPPKVWMGAPLKTATSVIGVIAIQNYEDSNSYSSEDLELLSMISGQIAIAIEKKMISDEKEKNREFFKRVIDTLENPLYVINISDYSIAIANNSAKKIIEGNVSINRDCYNLLKNNKKCNCSMWICPITKLIKTKHPVHFERVLNQGLIEEVIYEVFAFPLFDENGNVVQIIENLVDITERKRVEQKLIELAVFPEANPNIVMRINRDQEVSYMNTATTIILGEIGISKDNMHLCFPENLAELIEGMLYKGLEVKDSQVQINGHTLSWSFQTITGQEIIHCYAQDITKQVAQAEEINKLSMVATQSSNMIIITDLDGIVEYVNPYFCYVTGYEREEIVGSTLSKIKSGNMPDEIYADLWQSIQNGATWNGKLENKKNNGELYWESKTISPIVSKEGIVTSYLSIGTDITNELQFQSKLIESEKYTAIATLAAGVAHEFKNYLGGIIGNASFSLDEINMPNGLSLAKETLENIIDMGEKANDVAMSLLTFSKAKSDDCKREDLKKIISQSIKLVEKELEILSIEVTMHFDEIPLVYVSLSKIQQLLLNLFINAKHAIGTNGVITIALLNKENFVQIRVGDTGGGIDKDKLDKIFDPFYSTKGVWGEDKVSGTGMGLSICRNIAREHSGDLTVDSVLNVGSVFTLSLPITEETELVSTDFISNTEQKLIFFTLDHSIVKNYYEDACKCNYQILLVDNFDKIDRKIIKDTELVVCDAKFPAKLELYRMVEYCIANKQPYVMFNCGTLEYQLTELYENSVASYKDLPDFYKMIFDVQVEPIVVK